LEEFALTAVQEQFEARLRLLRSRGEARDGVLPIPLSGCGMAAAIELDGECLDEAQRRAANLCRVERHGEQWVFVNGNSAMVCAVNGVRIAAEASVAVAVGDTLEVGLLRFAFETRDADATIASTGPPSGVPPSAAARAPQSERAQANGPRTDGAFELHDLVRLVRAGQVAHVPQDDPFGALDIVGSPFRGHARSLSLLPDDKPAAWAGGSKRSAVPRRESARLMHSPGPGAQPTNPASALFDGLHEEFVRVVRDPTQLVGSVDWRERPTEMESAPTLDELSDLARPYPLLRDILLPREDVGQIIGSFDSLCESDLFDDLAETEDVLRLFAPELAHGAAKMIPSLTRREHHAVSLDSPMRLGALRAFDPQESPDSDDVGGNSDTKQFGGAR
jgi:hypothetical protein